jgi:hypothetical protein
MKGKIILIKMETEIRNNGTKSANSGLSVIINFTTEYPSPKDDKRTIKKIAMIFTFSGVTMADFILFDFLITARK